MTDLVMSYGSPPGTAWHALEAHRATRGGFSTVGDLAAAYGNNGILLNQEGIDLEAISFFTSVLETIEGFIAAFPWLPKETRQRPAPRSDWPIDTWLEVGSFDSPNAPTRRDFARTLFEPPRRGIWFDSTSHLLLDGKYIAKSLFEGAVHELGHVTMVHPGAEKAIQGAVGKVFGTGNPGDFVSLYARGSFEDFWAEATAAVNTQAWIRPPTMDRPRLAEFVGEVNSRSDVPLI